MKSQLIDTETDIEYVGDILTNDIVRSDTPMRSGKHALAADRARRNRFNSQQNIGRASHTRTNYADAFNANTWYPVVFTLLDTLPSYLRIFQMEYCAPLGMIGLAFVCQEPGWYNYKGAVSTKISVPAVYATKITEAECALIYTPEDRSSYTWFWQHTEYAQARLDPAFPPGVAEQMYLRGWTNPFADKMWMDAGDVVWVVHNYTGLGDVAYIERYESRWAVQRTGEPFIEETCCA